MGKLDDAHSRRILAEKVIDGEEAAILNAKLVFYERHVMELLNGVF